jgi:hypothetical protein
MHRFQLIFLPVSRFLLILVIFILLSACQAETPPTTTEGIEATSMEDATPTLTAIPPSPTGALEPTMTPQVGYPPPQDLADPTDGEQTPPYLPPPYEAPQTAPVVRAELEATDPATVNLAAGKVQLVEFFAFW